MLFIVFIIIFGILSFSMMSTVNGGENEQNSAADNEHDAEDDEADAVDDCKSAMSRSAFVDSCPLRGEAGHQCGVSSRVT